ncbi:uncharacterized protein LOC111603148 [Drosophila hydei]|uniref:Uncharacterized protein LOC111603148 n=1 Tax=Drosophila hydei TaxID=7224 RepID=A0A6J1M5N9_DROHY|nr:uncharacterized protein LOC111603148 [Drosophila hydei]
MAQTWQQFFELVKNLNFTRLKTESNATNGDPSTETGTSSDQACCSRSIRKTARTKKLNKKLAVHFDTTQLQHLEVNKPRYVSSTHLRLPSAAKKAAALKQSTISGMKQNNMSPNRVLKEGAKAHK